MACAEAVHPPTLKSRSSKGKSLLNSIPGKKRATTWGHGGGQNWGLKIVNGSNLWQGRNYKKVTSSLPCKGSENLDENTGPGEKECVGTTGTGQNLKRRKTFRLRGSMSRLQ